MAHKIKELGTDARGNYVRNLGWKLTETGGRAQQRFYLGKDSEEARRRNALLQELWAVIEAEAESPKTALWTATTLQIGIAIAGGEAVCHLASPLPLANEEDFRAYAYLVEKYSKKYRMIAILPADVQAYQQGKGITEERKREVVRIGRDVFGEANILEAETRTLHEAIDDYIAHIKVTFVDVETRAMTGWGNTQVKEAMRLKEKHSDIPLSRLDLSTIEAMMNLWRNRPLSQKSGEPIRVKTAESHIKRLKNFLWWLHRQDKYRRRIPPEVERLAVKVRETDRETQGRARPQQVEIYDVAELATLYKYALPLERVYLLLGLNCGFSIAEFGTLRLNQIFLRQKHGYDALVGYTSTPEQSWIKRVRIKTKVYGEFLLWPETVQAIEWAIDRRRKQPGFGEDALLCLTERGMPFVGQTKGGNNSTRLTKHWYHGLLDRVCKKDYPKFRRLSPKCLRKTSGNMIREIAGGEIMAVFHCRGQAVRTDHLADVYSNRPFGKVFRAIEEMRANLMPMFEAAQGEPFLERSRRVGLTSAWEQSKGFKHFTPQASGCQRSGGSSVWEIQPFTGISKGQSKVAPSLLFEPVALRVRFL